MEVKRGIIEILNEKLGAGIISADPAADIPTITVDSRSLFNIISYLKNDPDPGYSFLTDLCGIHYPGNELPFGVIYHLHNLRENRRVRVKTFLPLASPEVDTITPIFSSANWMERETFDFYGIVFHGHPNLKRILNVEYLDFFPMRKEYPLEDPTREDKDNRFFGRE
jgi:NADH-quinone oxidoreductase subunit C